MRTTRRPNGAYKLLVLLMYGSYTPNATEARIGSIRRVARQLGTEARRVRMWLEWLETQGYIESLVLSSDKRSATIGRIPTPKKAYIR